MNINRNEYPNKNYFTFDTDLAASVGLNESIFIGKLIGLFSNPSYETSKSTDENGVSWLGMTFNDWLDHLPFFSDRTLKRIVKRLECMGLIESKKLESSYLYHKKYYRISAKLKDMQEALR